MASIPSIVAKSARRYQRKLCKAIVGANNLRHQQQQQRRTLSNITAAEREEFEENGAVCLRGVFDKTWLKLTEKGFISFWFC